MINEQFIIETDFSSFPAKIKASGIYAIKNLLNDKVYIGSSNNIKKRWGQHLYDLRKGNHHSSRLQFSWNKYGCDRFAFILLEEVEGRTSLLEREQYYMDMFKAYDAEFGFNNRLLADSNLGTKRSEEFKKRIGFLSKGRKHTEESKKRISEANKGENAYWYGKNMPESAKKKLSEINTGKKLSEEGLKNLSIAVKKSYENRKSPGFGKKGENGFHATPILQYDKEGNFIRRWGSIVDAVRFIDPEEKNMKSMRCCIINCCKGRSKISLGFIWRYENKNK